MTIKEAIKAELRRQSEDHHSGFWLKEDEREPDYVQIDGRVNLELVIRAVFRECAR